MMGPTVLLAALLIGGPSEAEARAATEAASLFESGRYSESARAFEAAYDASGEPAYLFGWAQALRRAGNCKGAIEVLERFLDTNPPSADVAAGQDVIDACHEVLGLGPAPEPPPPVLVTEPEPSPRASESVDARWHKDVAGGVLLGTGLVAGATAGVLYGVARQQASLATGPESAFLDRRDRAGSLRNASIGVGIVSAALLTGAVVRYVVVHRRHGS